MEYAGRAQAPPAPAVDPPPAAGSPRPSGTSSVPGRTSTGPSPIRTTSACRSTTRSRSRCSGGSRTASAACSPTPGRARSTRAADGSAPRTGSAAAPPASRTTTTSTPTAAVAGLRRAPHLHLGDDLGAAVRPRQALAQRRRRFLDPRQLAAQLDAARALGPALHADGGRRPGQPRVHTATRGRTWSAIRRWTIDHRRPVLQRGGLRDPGEPVRQRGAQQPARPRVLERGPRPAEERPLRRQPRAAGAGGGVQRLQPHQLAIGGAPGSPRSTTRPPSAGSRRCSAGRASSSSGSAWCIEEDARARRRLRYAAVR